MGLFTLEGLGELPRGDMRDEAEVGAGGPQLVVHVKGGEVAIVQAQRSKGER